MHPQRTITWLGLSLLSPALVGADVSFTRQVAPILVEQCLECHRADKAKGSYRLDDFEALLKTGDSEVAPVVPGRPDKSELYRLLATHEADDRMPKKADPLPAGQQALVKKWIAEGAKFDASDRRAALTTLIPERPRPQSPEKYPRPLPVTALAISADGHTLAVSGWYEVTLWDAHSGVLKDRLGNLPEKINGLSWVGTTSILAVGGGTPMRSGELWLVDTAAKVPTPKRLFTTTDTVLTLATSADGSLLVAGGADNHVRLFSLPEGRLLWNTEPHADWIMALSISPDKKYIATASRDRTARLLDVGTGRIEATHMGHAVGVTAVTFPPDGKEVISGDAEGQVRRWSLDGEGKKDTTIRPTRQDILRIGHSEGRILVALADGRLGVLDPKIRKLTDTLVKHAERINTFVLSPSATQPRLITGAHDGQICVWDEKHKQDLLRFTASPGVADPKLTPLKKPTPPTPP